MGYITPADVGISDDRAAHIARGSKEPGTDYITAYGTDLRAPGAGRVIGVDHSNDGAEGRRLTFLMDNGEVIDWIHLSSISVGVGARVIPGQTGIARSGASGFGSDWYYGAHLHVTRRARQGLPYSQTLDFEDAIGGEAPASATPGTTPTQSEEDDMRIIYSQHLDREFLIGDGGITRLVGGASAAYNAIGVPGNRFTNQLGKNDFRMVVEGLGLSYERTRLLKPGERLEKDTRTNVVENAVAVLDAGNVPWGPDWA